MALKEERRKRLAHEALERSKRRVERWAMTQKHEATPRMAGRGHVG